VLNTGPNPRIPPGRSIGTMTTKLTIPGGETAPAQTPDTKPAITAKSEILRNRCLRPTIL
jgi:hypothetical protein